MSGICDTCKIKSRCISPDGGLLACPLYEQDRKSKWFELFGTPERAARTLFESTSECRCCVIRDECGYDLDKCVVYDRDALLEWLRGEAE